MNSILVVSEQDPMALLGLLVLVVLIFILQARYHMGLFKDTDKEDGIQDKGYFGFDEDDEC